jgi:cytochrome P450
MSYVFEGKVKLIKEELVEDTVLLQVAGSDTTLSALVNLLHLAVDNNIQRELRSEIDNVVPAHQSLRFSHIGNLPFLEGAIKETLRLHPPVPSGLPRETPQEGIWVDDIHISGGICVSIPTWSIHHGMSQ